MIGVPVRSMETVSPRCAARRTPHAPRPTDLSRCCSLALLVWLLAAAAFAESPIRFRDVTAESGIDFVHTHGGSGRKYIVETVTAGLATFDYDNDGLTDIYFLNGRPLAGTEANVHAKNRLYRNLGGMKFKDVTDQAGVGGGIGYGLGVCVADYDNDGYQDIYLSNYGENILYHNNGNGTFTDVARRAGVTRGNRVGAGTCFLDYDLDRRLDLFAANYVKFSEEKPVVRTISGFPVYADPTCDTPETHTLFHNNGDGTFTDVSVKSGIAARPSYGMGVVAADYDNDGYPDIFVANDASPNSLFHNDRQGKFKNVALLAGVACDIDGKPNANMGVDCGRLQQHRPAQLLRDLVPEPIGVTVQEPGRRPVRRRDPVQRGRQRHAALRHLGLWFC